MAIEKILTKRIPVSYSIWLMPDGVKRYLLKNLIHSLSLSLGGPTFEPHITLVSNILGSEESLLRHLRIISKVLKPFQIFFENIEYCDEFFRSLFIKITLNKELILAKDIACKYLNYYDNNFFPHLSLAYGNYNSSEKTKLIESLNITIGGFSVNNIYLAHNDENKLQWEVVDFFTVN